MKLAAKPLAEILREIGNPFTEFRGQRIAVCAHTLTEQQRARLWDAQDHAVYAVAGPFVELIKLTSE